MFRDQLKLARNGTEYVAGIKLQTPSGPIIVRGRADMRDTVSALKRQPRERIVCMDKTTLVGAIHNATIRQAIRAIEDVTDFFSIESVTDKRACEHAKTLFLAAQSTDPATADMAKLRITLIQRMARVGNTRAMDADYCLRREAKAALARAGHTDIVGFLPLLAAVPLAIKYGPAIVQKAGDTLSKARAGNKKAKEKIAATKQLAQAGVPEAKKAEAAYKQAQAIQSGVERQTTLELTGKDPKAPKAPSSRFMPFSSANVAAHYAHYSR